MNIIYIMFLCAIAIAQQDKITTCIEFVDTITNNCSNANTQTDADLCLEYMRICRSALETNYTMQNNISICTPMNVNDICYNITTNILVPEYFSIIRDDILKSILSSTEINCEQNAIYDYCNSILFNTTHASNIKHEVNDMMILIISITCSVSLLVLFIIVFSICIIKSYRTRRTHVEESKIANRIILFHNPIYEGTV